MSTSKPEFVVRQFGIEPYADIWQAMKAFSVSRTASVDDEVWCLQHAPVYTLGQAGKPEHILDAHGIPIVQSDRGGQVTYHGPGQLIIYLLIDLKRRSMGPRKLVDLIEQSIIKVLSSYGLASSVKKGAPGVYIEGKKVAALGLRVKKGCSYHGLSLNIAMDQAPFSWINPCGYAGLKTTQLKDLLQEDLLQGDGASLLDEVQKKLLHELNQGLHEFCYTKNPS